MEVRIYIEVDIENKIRNGYGMYLLEALKDGEPITIKGEPYVRYGFVDTEHLNSSRIAILCAIEALKRLTDTECKVELCTDLEVLYPLYNGWNFQWKKNGWKNSKGLAIKYQEEWAEITELMEQRNVTIERGWHSYKKWMRGELSKHKRLKEGA